MNDRPTIQRLGPDALLICGPALDLLRYAVAVTQRSRLRNGQPQLKALDLLAAAAAAGHAAAVEVPTEHAGAELISTDEAAKQIGCSTRTARRLAPRLGGRRQGGRWFLDQQAVVEHLEGGKPQ